MEVQGLAANAPPRSGGLLTAPSEGFSELEPVLSSFLAAFLLSVSISHLCFLHLSSFALFSYAPVLQTHTLPRHRKKIIA